jgi:hypothetical protein
VRGLDKFKLKQAGSGTALLFYCSYRPATISFRPRRLTDMSDNNMVRLTGLWKNKTKTGESFLAGTEIGTQFNIMEKFVWLI